MRIGTIIGRVTLASRLPDLPPGRLFIVQPEQQDALRGTAAADGEPLVVYDELGATLGVRVSFSEGREAAAPFHPGVAPVDAYLAALIDDVHLRPAAR